MQLFVHFYTFAKLINEMKFQQKFVSPIKNTWKYVLCFLSICMSLNFPMGPETSAESEHQVASAAVFQLCREEHSSKDRTYVAVSVANTKAISARNSCTVRTTSLEISCEIKLNRVCATSWRYAHLRLTTPRNGRIVEFESRIVVCVTIDRDRKSGERQRYRTLPRFRDPVGVRDRQKCRVKRGRSKTIR